ncbi:H/ACA RNA-protein complex component Cbf5p [miscellaneous Crenarchaeota group-15 archaeon DG-45]|uniref:Probable tRNA pseudouridine synthase B n=1 Tax=miscellaneous Crenarchaeota group-15 archaeon DG-45 TaxID=1685127 RepID=A0A0M0BPB9_9ARCH|nr:MAG: H/ACA RNA-protein complex component Cbf5p [miscellaneous Crenarchaeota group-15 archaeon DG-45]
MGVNPPWEITRTVITKAMEETGPDLGCPPDQRTLRHHIKFGILKIDKNPGPTSHEIVAWVKRLLELDKAGHGGTLDPRVTGVLPIALEEATKVVQALLEAGKEYVCLMRTHRDEEEPRVLEALEMFEGVIYQRPPIRASVKRRLRTRTIYRIDYLEGDGRDWLFKVACESGTYIRKLCYDVGEVLGGGAHMHELRRTRSGPFTEDGLITMYDLADAVDLLREEGDEGPLREIVHPMEAALGLLPKLWIRDSAVDAICTGAALAVPGVLRLESGVERGSMVAVMTQKGEGVALMRANMAGGEILELEHGIAATPLRVLMPRGTYPRMW